MQHATCNKAYYNCNKTCNAATMGQAHAHSQWRLSQWRGQSDGRSSRVTELWCPSEYSSSEKVPRDWLQLATKCIILSSYLIMHNSSATVLAVLSFRFYCSCNRGLKRGCRIRCALRTRCVLKFPINFTDQMTTQLYCWMVEDGFLPKRYEHRRYSLLLGGRGVLPSQLIGRYIFVKL